MEEDTSVVCDDDLLKQKMFCWAEWYSRNASTITSGKSLAHWFT